MLLIALLLINEYDVNENRAAVRYADEMVVSYEYDEVSRLVCGKALDTNGAPVVKYGYALEHWRSRSGG